MLGDHFCILAVLIVSHSANATELVDESCGTLAAALGMDDSIEKPRNDVKNKNLYSGALLLASYAIVCSRSDGKPTQQFQHKRHSPNIRCPLRLLTVTRRGTTLLLHSIPLGRLSATER